MCRMILALGNFDMSTLIDSAISMANDEYTLHELNNEHGQGTWSHYDGWGIAYRDENNEWNIVKSQHNISTDPLINTLRNITSKQVILHMRKKMGSEIKIENTHPFVVEGKKGNKHIFCHNGFIDEDIYFDSRFTLKGETDSEKLFFSILSDAMISSTMTQAIRQNFNRYKKLTGTNIILSNNSQTYVALRKNSFPKYYQMQMAKQDDMLIISSEKLPLISSQWESLEQEDVIIIDNNTTTALIQKNEEIKINNSLLQKTY